MQARDQRRRARAAAFPLAALAMSSLTAAPPASAASLCKAFQDAIADARSVVAAAPFVADEAERAEGPRYLAANITAALQDALLSADPARPQFGRGDLRYDLGLSNPDNVYYLARIEPGAEYRIVGAHGTSADLTIQALIGYPGTGSLGQNAGLLRLAQIDFSEGGRFEVGVSSEPRSGKWLEIAPGADTLVIRETFQDWASEQPGSYRLERVGGPRSDARPSRAQLGAALLEAAFLLRTQSDLYVRVVAGFLGLIPPGPGNPAPTALPPNVLTPPIETANGLPGQRSSIVQFALGEGQAMIVTASPSRFPYQGFQVGNVWFESFEWARHQTSLTTAQARADADGRYRFVISPTDPGVPNWLDTRGQRRGFAFMRWQGLDEDLPPADFPTAEIVDLASLRSELPADTPTIDPPTRQRLLAIREILASRRLRQTGGPVRELALRLGELARVLGTRCPFSNLVPRNATQVGTRNLD